MTIIFFLIIEKSCYHSSIGGAELMKKVGLGSGFGERVGWNLREVGERVGRMGKGEAIAQFHDFTYG